MAEPVEVTAPRAVKRITTANKVREGAGFIVRRPISNGSKCDPVIMLDHFGPVTYGPGEAVGAPDHPHRGQITISYLLSGSMQHKDSRGGSGTLQCGDVQVMTAGSGLIHSEMPSAAIMEHGGELEGFQIWVNLPAKLKMTQPGYQDIRAKKIPEYRDDEAGILVKVIAGDTPVNGVKARIELHTPILFYDVQLLKKGATFTQTIPTGHNAFAYVYRGRGSFGSNGQEAIEGQLVELDVGDSLRVDNPRSDEVRFLLLAGVPIAEPIEWQGPFVMNTPAEIQQAVRDYQAGKFGRIKGADERHAQAQAALKKSGGVPKQPSR